MPDPTGLAFRLMEATRMPLFVNRHQFDAAHAAGLYTSNMRITQMLPLMGEPAPAADILPPCQCVRCRIGDMGHA